MPEVTLTINGRNYSISCDAGQEQRLLDLSHYVDQRIKAIARAGAATNEAHLLVLTTLMLSDEVFDLRSNIDHMDMEIEQGASLREDEDMIAQAIDQLASRIDLIADRIQKA